MDWSGYNPMASISKNILWICNNENTLNRGHKCPRPQSSTQEKWFFGQTNLEKDGKGIEIKQPKLIILQGKSRVSCQPQSWGSEVGQDSSYSCRCRWMGKRLILCPVHWFAFDEWHTITTRRKKKRINSNNNKMNWLSQIREYWNNHQIITFPKEAKDHYWGNLT